MEFVSVPDASADDYDTEALVFPVAIGIGRIDGVPLDGELQPVMIIDVQGVVGDEEQRTRVQIAMHREQGIAVMAQLYVTYLRSGIAVGDLHAVFDEVRRQIEHAVSQGQSS
jgi:hypothetical protein